jgi:hypothetical protein
MGIKNTFFLTLLYLIGSQLFFSIYLFSQDTIYLRNPSFEDTPRSGSPFSPPIKEWNDCGLVDFPNETPPDIHSDNNEIWGVTLRPYEGKTYLGLVTRYSDTFESISQSLSKPVEAGKCYKFSVFLAVSQEYKSMTVRSLQERRINGNKSDFSSSMEDFSHAVELFIWGGDKYCNRRQLLVHSGPVIMYNWELFVLEFSPKATYQYITIGAYYRYGYKEPYNGHVLVDNLSPIIQTDCKN